ncbi:MAG: hypothetical protein U9N61_02085 [Euryarchaeota archaeon]|nr:hypothetical protein [Euryarchaeota archaeon]
MKGAKGRVKSYKFIDPITGVSTNDLIAGHKYNIEIKLDSYPRYFHNKRKVSNDYGTLELESFKDANGRGRIWIPVLQIDGEPAKDKWVPLTSSGSAVCMIGMPTCAETGRELRNTEIWIDNNYIHKYAPEDIYFCAGCLFDTYADCGFGEHLISLVKKGYDTYEQVITLEDGDLIDLDPMLVRTTQTKEQLESATPLTLKQERASVRITLYG